MGVMATGALLQAATFEDAINQGLQEEKSRMKWVPEPIRHKYRDWFNARKLFFKETYQWPEYAKGKAKARWREILRQYAPRFSYAQLTPEARREVKRGLPIKLAILGPEASQMWDKIRHESGSIEHYTKLWQEALAIGDIKKADEYREWLFTELRKAYPEIKPAPYIPFWSEQLAKLAGVKPELIPALVARDEPMRKLMQPFAPSQEALLKVLAHIPEPVTMVAMTGVGDSVWDALDPEKRWAFLNETFHGLTAADLPIEENTMAKYLSFVAGVGDIGVLFKIVKILKLPQMMGTLRDVRRWRYGTRKDAELLTQAAKRVGEATYTTPMGRGGVPFVKELISGAEEIVSAVPVKQRPLVVALLGEGLSSARRRIQQTTGKLGRVERPLLEYEQIITEARRPLPPVATTVAKEASQEIRNTVKVAQTELTQQIDDVQTHIKSIAAQRKDILSKRAKTEVGIERDRLKAQDIVLRSEQTGLNVQLRDLKHQERTVVGRVMRDVHTRFRKVAETREQSLKDIAKLEKEQDIALKAARREAKKKPKAVAFPTAEAEAVEKAPAAGRAVDQILSMIGEPVEKKLPGGFKRLRFEITERFMGAEDFMKMAHRYSKKPIPIEADAFVAVRNYAGRAGIIEVAIRDLKKILAPVRNFWVRTATGKRDRAFTAFALSKRAGERVARSILTPKVASEELTIRAINELEAQFGSRVMDLFRKQWELFQEWAHKYILTPTRNSGVISDDMYRAILKDNKNWAPFNVLYHMPDDIHALPMGSEVFSVSKNRVVRAMRGTTKEIQDPWEAVAQRIVDSVSTNERNAAARMFIKIADDVPELKAVIRPMPTELKPPPGWESMSVFIEGSVHKYMVPEELGMAIKQMVSPQSTHLLANLMRWTVGAFRAGATTLYLPFTMSNVFRDYGMAKLTQGKNINIPRWTQGAFEALKDSYGFDSKLVREFLENKGGFSGFVHQMRANQKVLAKTFWESDAERMAKLVLNPFGHLRRISETFEMTPRLAIYKRMRELGKSPAEAAFAARTATIDFARSGRSMKIWNQWVPFLNARTQALTIVYRVAKTNPMHAAAVANAFILPGFTTYCWNRVYYSDLYDDVPQWIKDNYFVFIHGSTKDESGNVVPKMILFPLTDIGQIFYKPIENALEYAYHRGEKDSVIRLAIDHVSDVSPIEFAREGTLSLEKVLASALPPFVRTPVEVAAGRTFYLGRPTIPRRLEKVSPEEHMPDATAIEQWLAETLGISPYETRAFLGGMFAGFGRVAMNPLEMFSQVATRFVRAQGGEKRDRAYEVLEAAQIGYYTTRLKAERLLKENKRHQAIELLREWNRIVQKTRKALEELDWPDIDKEMRSVRFDSPDINRLIKQVRKEERK
uniref:Large polyvalent protein associated domain-containing protein n=1 Tax=viral metagenome TaxID=1070528 RepID=A0A6H1ZIP3_9ZZZZ